MSNNPGTILEYQSRINRVMNYIDCHLKDSLSLEDLSEVALFSKYHFHRIFHALVGETLSQFVLRLRLERAAQMLLYDSKKSVTDIGYEYGFSSSQNFARAFKKHFKTAPSAFRKQKKQGIKETRDTFMSETFRIDQPLMPLQMDVDVREFDTVRVAYVRLMDDYDPQKIAPMFTKLFSWASARKLIAQDTLVLGVSWDDIEISSKGKLRYDACVSIPQHYNAAPMDTQVLAGGKCAVYSCVVGDMDFSRPWKDLIRKWLPSSGYQPDARPCFEIYKNNGYEDPQNRWFVDICLPVRFL